MTINFTGSLVTGHTKRSSLLVTLTTELSQAHECTPILANPADRVCITEMLVLIQSR